MLMRCVGALVEITNDVAFGSVDDTGQVLVAVYRWFDGIFVASKILRPTRSRDVAMYLSSSGACGDMLL